MKFIWTLVCAVSALEFQDWVVDQGRSYTPEEYRLRAYIFTKNKQQIEYWNAQPGRTVQLALNAFADLSQDEFAAQYLGGYQHMENEPHAYERSSVYVSLPETVDWVTKGAVTSVKNQGQCGSCWAFSTTGSVEGAWFLKSGQLVSLSEQQLVDCSTAEGNMGCNGGMMDQAFQYIIKNGGICSESVYPYTSGDGSNGTCHTCQTVAHISSFVDVQPNNETALLEAVVQRPVSVAVEADGLDWQFYFGGVVTDSCGTNLDHGVLVVGYGTDTVAGDFWKVKNSWGETWGESGYIRLGRGSKFAPHGECGILMDPSYPVV
jgi:C1A family cysteine protease